MERFAAPIAEQIWDMKYRLKEADGTIIDHTVEDTWRRIASALASVEKDPAKWEQIFYEALEDFQFLPAGRIISGAGTKRNVTLFNCFVMGTVPDDLSGIFEGLKEAALTMQQGGGVGYDFSTIRPKGALVKGVAADASGPLSFMDVWDSMCRTIMSAGSRRGAMMATLRCDHPDIEAFIEAKRDPARLRMFNLSVLATDPFMKAVKDDAPWDLVFGGKVYKTIQARDLWNKIMRNTYDFAEPGVIFIDRINKMNNLWYAETIAATNPCVTGETPVLTSRGYRPIRDLVGRKVEVWNGKEWSETTPFSTGVNPLVEVKFSDGTSLTCTPYHKFVLQQGFARGPQSRVEAKDLVVGDRLAKFEMPVVEGNVNPAVDAYSQGFYSGDGTEGYKKSFLYGPKEMCAKRLVGAVADQKEIASEQESTRAMWYHGEMLAKDFVPLHASVNYKLNWLAGLCDSDGTVLTYDNGKAIQIASVNKDFLLSLRLMLTTLGVQAKVSLMKDAGTVQVRPSEKVYNTKACWRLLINCQDVYHLHDELGMVCERLDLRQPYPQRDARRFVTVESVTPLERTEETFCFTEPKNNAGTFNGIVTGQCGEQPLPPYGACLLGSINLAKLVELPFEDGCHLNMVRLDRLVRTAVRMMDNVIDASGFPLREQDGEAFAKRRIGLGVTGLADALLMIGRRYGSDEAVKTTERWMKAIARSAYLASVDLAKEKGAFPLFEAEKFLASGNMLMMDEDIRTQVRLHGIRNALLTSIAPTGTISLYAGNVSSGIEPVFAYSYTRKVRQKDESKREEEVVDYAVQMWREKFGDAPLPDYFVNAQTLAPLDHVKMQAAAQRWVDSSISKTINCPEDISFEDFKAVYEEAYATGCKGCTTYRPNDVTGSVLSVEPKKEVAAPTTATATVPPRPQRISGSTYKMKWPGDAHSIYITINSTDDGPFEVFFNTKNVEHHAWMVALSLTISAVFRRGGDVSFIAKELKEVFDPKGGAWVEGKYVPSMIAAIGDIILKHIDPAPAVSVDPVPSFMMIIPKGKSCPACGSHNTKNENGCFQCLDCGNSKCG